MGLNSDIRGRKKGGGEREKERELCVKETRQMFFLFFFFFTYALRKTDEGEQPKETNISNLKKRSIDFCFVVKSDNRR